VPESLATFLRSVDLTPAQRHAQARARAEGGVRKGGADEASELGPNRHPRPGVCLMDAGIATFSRWAAR
jgi:hypothetical protein